ncbi:MAG: hypothetical protein U0T84_13800 [Chitinophagales bacterium]
MRKITFLFAIIALVLSSSCKKSCVQCHAVDASGVTVNTSNKVCEANPNRKTFVDRYHDIFASYAVGCVETDN